jgi:predicted nucleic-acid-binding Zn-ribbon protein
MTVACPKCSAELRVNVIEGALPGPPNEPRCPRCGCEEFYRRGLIGPLPLGPVTIRLETIT